MCQRTNLNKHMDKYFQIRPLQINQKFKIFKWQNSTNIITLKIVYKKDIKIKLMKVSIKKLKEITIKIK